MVPPQPEDGRDEVAVDGQGGKKLKRNRRAAKEVDAAQVAAGVRGTPRRRRSSGGASPVRRCRSSGGEAPCGVGGGQVQIADSEVAPRGRLDLSEAREWRTARGLRRGR